MLLMIDNYDSFTYNLVQYFQEMDEEVRVFRNDAVTVEAIKELAPDRLVISPGPCDPLKAGISVEAIKVFAGKVPVLGVCLGHQSVAHAFGGRVVRAQRLMHGKTSMVHHDGKTIYEGIDDPFEATRYHSLIVERESLPGCFEVSAWTGQEDGLYEIMGIRHKDIPLEGMQFHPESILTGAGKQVLSNFLKLRV
ncbi:Anthranilate synthase, amidotransferase component @ Para-aminobenzoate synthase, amidotransferase component [hydrothermal vent metagenome]|uniref:Anthranilate synthase, amidotransferase component @ Para-aminobenzoate synthase, amidotransferase component n=1 Tax=hydrothermal vent metagenome TaxID=652676 RepID=A0A3B0V7M3_9ZZZZ